LGFFWFFLVFCLDYMTGDVSSNALLQQSCLSSLRVIFASVSQFLSPYLGQILHLTTHSKLVGNVCTIFYIFNFLW
jgi:hypothetical protein